MQWEMAMHFFEIFCSQQALWKMWPHWSRRHGAAYSTSQPHIMQKSFFDPPVVLLGHFSSKQPTHVAPSLQTKSADIVKIQTILQHRAPYVFANASAARMSAGKRGCAALRCAKLALGLSTNYPRPDLLCIPTDLCIAEPATNTKKKG
jgi:hypothetical protein